MTYPFLYTSLSRPLGFWIQTTIKKNEEQDFEFVKENECQIRTKSPLSKEQLHALELQLVSPLFHSEEEKEALQWEIWNDLQLEIYSKSDIESIIKSDDKIEFCNDIYRAFIRLNGTIYCHEAICIVRENIVSQITSK